jgi:hypothetical protein
MSLALIHQRECFVVNLTYLGHKRNRGRAQFGYSWAPLDRLLSLPQRRNIVGQSILFNEGTAHSYLRSGWRASDSLLKVVEYRFLVIEHSIEIYGGLVAALFAGLGIWLGLKLTRNKETVVIKEVPIAPPERFTLNQSGSRSWGSRHGSSRSWN